MIRVGTPVEWEWGSGVATGKVVERHESSVTRTIDGSDVARNGSVGDPALVIEQDDGSRVLKLKSEVRRKE